MLHSRSMPHRSRSPLIAPSLRNDHGLSRRAALGILGGLALPLSSCVSRGRAEPRQVPPVTENVLPRVPFGARPQPFAEGAIFPSMGQGKQDDAVLTFYKHWKKTYLTSGCGPGEIVVRAQTRPNNLTVSEAHGYGMVIVAYMAGADPDAKQHFDGMMRYHRAHLSRLTSGIMAWNQSTACVDVGGDNGATDGDLDVAYGLLLADKQWGSSAQVDYLGTADWVLAAISRSSIDGEGRYPLLGDWVKPGTGHYPGTRVSDFMGGHFRAFQKVQKDPVWPGVLENTYWIAETLQTMHAPKTGLLPDFAEGLDVGSPRPAHAGYLEGARDGSYAYNACRIPLRMGTDFLVSGDERPRRIARRLNRFFKEVSEGDPKKLRGGYFLDGRPMVDYETMAFTAPLAVGAMTEPDDQKWLDALFDHCIERETEHYYEDTLRMLSLIALSGNFWAP